jgi:hypothetical protein
MGRITIRKIKKGYMISEDGQPITVRKLKVEAQKKAFRLREQNKK